LLIQGGYQNHAECQITFGYPLSRRRGTTQALASSRPNHSRTITMCGQFLLYRQTFSMKLATVTSRSITPLTATALGASPYAISLFSQGSTVALTSSNKMLWTSTKSFKGESFRLKRPLIPL